MIKQKYFIIGSFILIIFFLFLPFLFTFKIKNKSIVQLKKSSYKESVNLKSKIKSDDVLDIKSDSYLLIDKVYVSVGDNIKKGDVLFSAYQINEESIKNVVNLSDTKEYIELKKDYYSDKDGNVKKVNMKEKDIKSQNDVLVRLSNDNNLALFIDVLPENINDIKIGMDVEFTLESNKEKIYKAKIEKIDKNISKKVDELNIIEYFTAIAKIEEKDDMLIENLNAKSKVFISKEKEIKTLPLTSIEQDKDGEFVYKLLNNSVKKTYVITGKEFEHETEIISGIDENDFIIENVKDINKKNIVKVN